MSADGLSACQHALRTRRGQHAAIAGAHAARVRFRKQPKSMYSVEVSSAFTTYTGTLFSRGYMYSVEVSYAFTHFVLAEVYVIFSLRGSTLVLLSLSFIAGAHFHLRRSGGQKCAS